MPVHPRVCGEQLLVAMWYVNFPGSSPRVRGTGAFSPIPDQLQRFIPACAGNSLPLHAPGPRAPVHPRVCGEQTAVKRDVCAISGSSPRVRGTVQSAANSRKS